MDHVNPISSLCPAAGGLVLIEGTRDRLDGLGAGYTSEVSYDVAAMTFTYGDDP